VLASSYPLSWLVGVVVRLVAAVVDRVVIFVQIFLAACRLHPDL